MKPEMSERHADCLRVSQVVSVCKAVKKFVARVKANLEFDRVATQEVSRVLKNLSATLIEAAAVPVGGHGVDEKGVVTDVYKMQTLIRELYVSGLP